MDDTGKCTADAGGFADAFGYLKELKDAGATFNTDGNALKAAFQTGEINAIIDGPWQTADFRTALGENLAVAPIPAGPTAAANPFTGTDGWYINPNLEPEQAKLAVDIALALTSQEAMQVMSTMPATCRPTPRSTITDPITQGFADAAARRSAAAAERAVRQLVGPVRRCAEQGHRHRRRPGHRRRRRVRPDGRGERPVGPLLVSTDGGVHRASPSSDTLEPPDLEFARSTRSESVRARWRLPPPRCPSAAEAPGCHAASSRTCTWCRRSS